MGYQPPSAVFIMRLQRTITKERSDMEVFHGRIVISVGVISGTSPRSPSTTSNACTFLLERKRSPAGAAGGNAFPGRQERPSGWGHRSASRGPVPFRTRLGERSQSLGAGRYQVIGTAVIKTSLIHLREQSPRRECLENDCRVAGERIRTLLAQSLDEPKTSATRP